MAVGAVPGRDAVAPPQLAADVPVVDVLHPVEEDLLEALAARSPVRPSRTAAIALSAIGLTLMNHCVLMRGSMTSLLRSQRPRTISCGAAADEVAARLEVGQDAAGGPRAASARRTAPPFSLMWPSSVITSIIGRPWRAAVSKSSWSCAGVILTAPVPKSRSHDVVGDDRARRARRTGSARGARRAPCSASSSGCTATAVSPRMRLRPRRGDGDRRVGIGRAVVAHEVVADDHSVPFSGVAMTSRSDTLVWQPGHQLTSCSPR